MNSITESNYRDQENPREIKYTEVINTTSSAVRAIYLDRPSQSIFFEFPNGTISRRDFDGAAHALLSAIREHGNSVGKYWNETGSKLRGAVTLHNVEQFTLREDVDSAAEATSLIVALEVNAKWDDLVTMQEVLRKAGFATRLRRVEAVDE